MATVVSGCPRSGTSLMMFCLSKIYGKSFIIGDKFPQENKTKLQVELEKHINPDSNKDFQKYKDMNPCGFWECKYTVKGASYDASDLHNLQKLKKSENFVKIVSQGLIKTNPIYVDKIIYMIRHPRAVAKSQERLGRPGIPAAFLDKGNIHTPEMFISVTHMAAKWFINNSYKDVLIVNYDDLIRYPAETLKNITFFIGEGNAEKAYDCIDQNLSRSRATDIKNRFWYDSEIVWKYLKKEAWIDIDYYLSRKDITWNKERGNYPCLRFEYNVNIDVCENCRENYQEFVSGHPRAKLDKPCTREIIERLQNENN